MKKILLSAAALVSSLTFADVTLQLNFDYNKDNVTHHKSVKCVIAPNSATRITADDLEITVLAQPQDSNVIEFGFEFFAKNNDGSYAMIGEPVVIKAEYNKEAEISLNKDNETFSLKIIAQHEDDAL